MKKLSKLFVAFSLAATLAGCSSSPSTPASSASSAETGPDTSGKIRMNLYVMSDEYKEAHPDLYEAKKLSTEFKTVREEVESYTRGYFITSISSDTNNQKLAIDHLSAILDYNIKCFDKTSPESAARSLYRNVHDILLLNAEDVASFKDTKEFANFDTETRIVHSIYLEPDTEAVTVTDTTLIDEPFAVFIGGNDTEGELKLNGRTDVDMICVVNPKTKQVGIFSYPRDSYVPNPALGNGPDKLTHLGASGINNTLKGIERILDIQIDHYVLVNFTTYMNCINALGGVVVDNPYAFDYSYDHSASFPEGKVKLKDWPALAYVRERKSLRDGDFGRNDHQQIVMKAIIEKISSPDVLVHIGSLFEELKPNFLSDIPEEAIISFMQYQLKDNVEWNVVKYSCKGGTGSASCASAPSMMLSCVFPYSNQMDFMAETAKKILNGETVEQEELPKGYGRKW